MIPTFSEEFLDPCDMEVLRNDDDTLVLKGILEHEDVVYGCTCIDSHIVYKYRSFGNSILNQIIPHDIPFEESFFPESSADDNLLYTTTSIEIET